MSKDLKQPGQPLPPQHELHPKDMSPSPIGSYPNMFSRHHGLNVPPPQQMHSREEELRR